MKRRKTIHIHSATEEHHLAHNVRKPSLEKCIHLCSKSWGKDSMCKVPEEEKSMECLKISEKAPVTEVIWARRWAVGNRTEQV